MTNTVISSANKEVIIGFDQPFVVIGERINPTGRKLLAEEMKAGDYSRVQADAIAQVEAGAQILDVNAGIPLADVVRGGHEGEVCYCELPGFLASFNHGVGMHFREMTDLDQACDQCDYSNESYADLNEGLTAGCGVASGEWRVDVTSRSATPCEALAKEEPLIPGTQHLPLVTCHLPLHLNVLSLIRHLLSVRVQAPGRWCSASCLWIASRSLLL